MKILLSQYVDGIGGSEIYLMKLAPKLQELGINVHFALLVSNPNKEQVHYFSETLKAAGIKVTAFQFNKLPRLSQLRKLNSYIKHEKFDLVHSNLLITDWIFSWLKRLFLSKFILVSTKHGYQESYNNKFGLEVNYKFLDSYRLLAKFVENSIDRSFAVSHSLKKLFEGLKIVSAKTMDVILHGFDYPDTISKKEYRIAEQQVIIVGRLIPLKGHIYALRAIASLRNKYPKLKLVIVGSGILEEELKQTCQELSISNEVLFTGFQTNTLEWMASSDIVLIPSLIEAFGLVLLEAMAVKKPIIAFDLPAMNEIVQHEITGLLCTPYSQEAFTNSVERLLDHPELAVKYGKVGYEMQKKDYSLSRMAEQTIHFYKDVITNNGNSFLK